MQIEKRTVGYHDQRSGEPPECASLPLEIFEGDEFFACFGPLPAGYRAVEKKTDSGPDFRLTRSRHPSASGGRIGSPPGDGWAAWRDPKGNRRVFYEAGL